MTSLIHVRRRPSEAFGPVPLGFPPAPPVDLGAGLAVGLPVTVTVHEGVDISGVVTALTTDWITVEAAR